MLCTAKAKVIYTKPIAYLIDFNESAVMVFL